jgi:hypothetical protein
MQGDNFSYEFPTVSGNGCIPPGFVVAIAVSRMQGHFPRPGVHEPKRHNGKMRSATRSVRRPVKPIHGASLNLGGK